jgi:hypothetical protein
VEFGGVLILPAMARRTIETVFAQLIKWADMVIQKSVNQPMLPFAIIVINGLKKEVRGPHQYPYECIAHTNQSVGEQRGRLVERRTD